MRRKLLIGGLLLAVMGLSAVGLRAQTAKQYQKSMFHRLAARLPKANLKQLHAAGAQANRASRLTVGLQITDAVFVDNDGSGDDLTFGDTFHLFGAILSGAGRELGTWEATVTLTTDHSPLGLTLMTLRFYNSGTVVVSGSPYADGARLRDAVGARVPLAPIVGTTGRMNHLRNSAGFAWDDRSELLIVALGVK